MSKLSTANFMALINNSGNTLPSSFGKTKRKTKRVLTVKQKTVIKKKISLLEKKFKTANKKVKAEKKKMGSLFGKIKNEKKKLIKTKCSIKPKSTRKNNKFGSWWDNTQSSYALACTGQQCADPKKMNRYPYEGDWKPYPPLKFGKTKKTKYGTPPIMGAEQYGGFPNAVISPYPFVR
jgi:hypothetical protein